jgi:hypothetical protein
MRTESLTHWVSEAKFGLPAAIVSGEVLLKGLEE